jgi:hypothetical protein
MKQSHIKNGYFMDKKGIINSEDKYCDRYEI